MSRKLNNKNKVHAKMVAEPKIWILPEGLKLEFQAKIAKALIPKKERKKGKEVFDFELSIWFNLWFSFSIFSFFW
jgi:hypothetical protein